MKTKIRLYISDPLNKLFNLNTRGLEEKFSILDGAWKKQEKKILNGLEKITGFYFLQNYIDVFLVDPNTSHSCSHPIIIGTNGSSSKFVRILIHELIHKLTWDNTIKIDWHTKIEKIFIKESRLCSDHVMVHAVMEALYKDILNKPEEIEEDIKMCKDMPAYKKAWEIVREKGYENILEVLKNK